MNIYKSLVGTLLNFLKMFGLYMIYYVLKYGCKNSETADKLMHKSWKLTSYVPYVGKK